MNRRWAVALFLASACLPSAAVLAQEKKGGNSAQPAAARPNAGQKEKTAQPPRSGKPDPHPGERALERLQSMTPEQRTKALANLPPQRRQEIEQKLDVLDRLPPAERTRVHNQLERLNSLPPQRQNQVRRSIKQFQELPDDRKALLKQELDRMAAMPDDARRAWMNTEEFRNRYTPNEQQMMQNLSVVLPENRDNKD